MTTSHVVSRARAGVAAALVLASSPVLANGRYPSAQQLVVDPANPNRMWLRATYGLLTSADAGKHWSWICELAAGYRSGEDPAVVMGADGTVLVGGLNGLFATSNQGCNWSQVSELGAYTIQDLTTESDTSHVFVLANLRTPTGRNELSVWRSTDSGHTFHIVGAPLPGDLVGKTIDVAPSDSTRIAVTALPNRGNQPDSGADAGGGSPIGILLVSIDSGASFDRRAITGLSIDEDPFIAAIHPTNPDVIYLRARGPEVDSGFVHSRLLFTDTGGTTWRDIFRGDADMLGFALFDGGNTVLVGLGDSHDALGGRPVDPGAIGIYRGSSPNFTFDRALKGQVGCLTATTAGVFVCGSNAMGYEIGLSADRGETASKVMEFGAQIHLLSCPGTSSAAAECADNWGLVMCEQIGKCSVPTAAGTDAGTATAPSGGGCCSSRATAQNQSTSAGAARLDLPFASPGLLALVGTALGLSRRLVRLRRPRANAPRSSCSVRRRP